MMMDKMGVDTPPKVRLVRCPKCSNLLPEPPGVPIYSCGGCGTFLQAKSKKTSDAGRTGIDPPIHKNAINESRKEAKNALAPPEEEEEEEEEDCISNKEDAALKTDNSLEDRDESSCSEKLEATQQRLGLHQSMEAAAVDRSSISTANIEYPHEGNEEAKENGCCSNQSLHCTLSEKEDTAAMAMGGYISVPHSQPQVEQGQKNTNFVEETVAGNVGSDNQIVGASDDVSTSDIKQEAAQINGSAQEETARETIICQATASSSSSSFAVEEEQFRNLDTYVGVKYQDSTANKAAGDINESQSQQPTRRSRDEQLQSGEEIFFISEEEKKLREELLLLLNHPTPDVSEMLMIKGLDPVRGTRYRTLSSESYDQWGGEGPSNREPEKFLYSSSLHSEQDKTELLRVMLLQLEEQVRRMRHSTSHTTSSQAETTGSSEMRNRFHSGTLNRMRNHRFSQPYFSSSSGLYYSPSSPSWDFETKSVDQLSNNTKFSYQQRQEVHVPKRHVRAVAGGAPVVTCYQGCSAVLQLPEDFLLSKRKRFHWLKCGSCSTVLRFSLQNGTHIVPYREGGGPEQNGRRETEEAQRKRSSALHKLMGYSSVTQLVIGSGESDQTTV